MFSSMSQKEQLLDLLLVTQERGGQAYSRLLRRGMTHEAAKVRSRNRALLRCIEKLWVDIARDWAGTSKLRIKDVKSLNSRIKRAVTGLKDRRKRAKRAISIISLLDDVISIATGL